MPRKNIYIRQEDEPLLEKAVKEFGQEKALGVIMMEALEDKMNNLPKVKKKALRYKLLEQLDVPAFNEIIKYKMKNFSEPVAIKAEYKALAAYTANPDHFSTPIADDETNNSFMSWHEGWIETFIWNGLDALIKENKDWFEQAEVLIDKGIEKLNKMDEDYKKGNFEEIDLEKEIDNSKNE